MLNVFNMIIIIPSSVTLSMIELIVFMPKAIMLTVDLLSVVMLSAQCNECHCYGFKCHYAERCYAEQQ
jgi:hypothetical protein